MAEAAFLELPYPEAAVVDEESLTEQNLALAAALPDRPLVLGGCCCSHVGAVEGLATRYDRLAVVWFDAHGDLNTPESSPSGNPWGMPLRMLLDSGTVHRPTSSSSARGTSTRRRSSSSPQRASHRRGRVGEALEGADAVYVAFDVRRARSGGRGGRASCPSRAASRSSRRRHAPRGSPPRGRSPAPG